MNIKTCGDITYSLHISWVLLDNEVFIFDESNDKILLLRGMEKDFWIFIARYSNMHQLLQKLLEIYPGKKEDILRKASFYKAKNLIVWDGTI